MNRVHILSWDWRGQPDLDELDRIVYNISCLGSPVRIQKIETGSDQYAIAISNRELPEQMLRQAWLERGEE